jgi:rod shape determining protein RodA
VQAVLRADGYQPWQALVAIGGGGVDGFGYMQGPQSRFDFLPYRDGDYVFAVLAEELGLFGVAVVLGLVLAQVLLLLAAADRTRERFSRLLLVGVAAWIGAQTLMHVAVCSWLAPATGLPMPFVSHGGSSSVALLLAVGVCLNVASRNSPVLSGDGFRTG